VGEKGQSAVEDYLFARYSMYSQVYYHKKNLAVRSLLAKLINRAKDIARTNGCFMDSPTRKWFMGSVALSVDEYLELDDIQLTYHIKQWTKAADPILCDLASRFLNRRLFKAMHIPNIEAGGMAEIENEARKIAKLKGFDPDYYIATESTGFRPYDYYRPDSDLPQTNIMVRTEDGATVELSQLSLTIEALVKGNYQSQWLIFPAEIADSLTNIRKLISSPN
jgi:hypothetical protein